MKLELIEAYSHKEEVKVLFTEYTNMLIKCDKDFKEYLNKQNYDNKLEHLESKYGKPYGRLYLAFCDNELAGCIGLRKIDDENCEMKRLYVKPEFTGKNIGHILVEKIVEDARNIGYTHILLDTFPFLGTAIKLYKKLGFYEIESYNNSPMDNLIYLKFDL
jgi:ribosomal protein S18 acetylase RimI-like enzyme